MATSFGTEIHLIVFFCKNSFPQNLQANGHPLDVWNDADTPFPRSAASYFDRSSNSYGVSGSSSRLIISGESPVKTISKFLSDDLVSVTVTGKSISTTNGKLLKVLALPFGASES